MDKQGAEYVAGGSGGNLLGQDLARGESASEGVAGEIPVQYASGGIQDHEDGVETCLYRHFSETGELLYVGISLSVLSRQCQHRAAPWFSEVTKITIERFGSREEAAAMEKAAIRREQPKYNVMHVQSKSEMDEPLSIGVSLPKRVSDSIDEWRRRQPELPNRSQAIRMLVTQYLDKQDAELERREKAK